MANRRAASTSKPCPQLSFPERGADFARQLAKQLDSMSDFWAFQYDPKKVERGMRIAADLLPILVNCAEFLCALGINLTRVVPDKVRIETKRAAHALDQLFPGAAHTKPAPTSGRPKSIRKQRMIAMICEMMDHGCYDWKGPEGIAAAVNNHFGTSLSPSSLRTYYKRGSQH